MFRTNAIYTLREQFFHIHISNDHAKQLFLYPEISGYGEYSGSYYCSRTSFLHYQLMLVTKGAIHLHTERGDSIVKSNEAFLIESKSPHFYYPLNQEEFSAYWLHFNGALMDALFTYIWESNHTQSYSTSELFHHRFDELLRNLSSDRPYSELELSARITQLLSMLQPPQNRGNVGIDAVCQYLQENYQRRVSLGEMAEISYMSVSHFCNRFKQQTGIAPHQYILNLRLVAGYHRLFSTSDTVAQIAEQLGFCSSSAFIAAFSTKYGITPIALRKKSEKASVSLALFPASSPLSETD